MGILVRPCGAVALMFVAGGASAGGLWLNEFGDFAGGRAAAGAAAGVDSAMTLAYNPASISRLRGNQLLVSAGAIVAESRFDIRYSSPRNGFDDGGNAGETTAYASMAYVHDLGSERWSAGIALVPLAGAGLDYRDDWVGRFQATRVDLQVMALSPTLAWRVNDSLTLGLSLQLVYADLEQDFAIPRLDPRQPEGRGKLSGDDVLPGFKLGVMYELSERTRFGFSYQSELQPDFGGDVKTQPAGLDVDTKTKLDFGANARFSVHQDMDEHWSVHFSVGWDNWSALGNLLVATEEREGDLSTDWRDTYHVAWGAQYRLDARWTMTGGVAYDSNPVKSRNRSPFLPVDEQIRYALGAQYAISDTLVVGGYVNYMDLGSARITSERFGGRYDDNNATQLIANLAWTF